MVLSSGNGRRFPIGPYIHQDDEFNFVTFAHIFDPSIWEGEHIHFAEVFSNPSILDGIDLWFIHTDTADCEKLHMVAARDYAQRLGARVVTHLNGAHGANFMCGSWPVHEFWKGFDAISIATNEPAAVEAFEALTGKPCMGTMLPYVEEYFDHMVRLGGEVKDIDIPNDAGERLLV